MNVIFKIKMLGKDKEITNKNTILNEIDKALGKDKPPAIELLFFQPFSKFTFWGINIPNLPFGHVAVRYTYKGENKIMNIIGYDPDNKMINFVDPTEYLFGTNFEGCPSPQGGIYNREIVSIRIEEYSEEKIKWIDDFFNKTNTKDIEQKASFSLVLFIIFNAIKDYLPFSLSESGNCSYWTSKGLVESELLNYPLMWPKLIFIQLFEQEARKDKNNVNVVLYKNAKESQRKYGSSNNLPIVRPTSPYQLLYNIEYHNLDKFANIIVEIENDTAVIIKKERVEASYFRYHRSEILFGIGAIGYLAHFVIKKDKNNTVLHRTFTKSKKIWDILKNHKVTVNANESIKKRSQLIRNNKSFKKVMSKIRKIK